MAGFADEDDFFGLGSLQNFVELRDVFIVGFVATADNGNNIVIWESLYSNTGR